MSGKEIQIIRYKHLDFGYPQCPTQAYPGDAGWDLYVSRDIIIPPKSFRDVPVDIAAEFPDGIFGIIFGRSSASRRHKLKVEPAIIDNGYRGSLHIGVRNFSWKFTKVETGTRLAQLVPFELIPLVWRQTRALNGSERARNGFGSSGI